MKPPYATAKTKPWSSYETAGLPCTRSKPYKIQSEHFTSHKLSNTLNSDATICVQI
jgi:hypothetical protein